MHSDSWLWFQKVLVKFVLFGAPTGGILWYWKHRTLQSKTLYSTSRANFALYLLWLTIAIIMFAMSASPTYRPMIPSALPANMFFIIPFLSAFGSLFLCMLSLRAEKGERRFVVMSNGLMLILWASVVVAPN